MLKSILKYKFPIVLVAILYFTHLYTKDFSSPYEKPIVGDSKAYYAYLPAIFIYQDSQYGFIDDYEAKYYANNQRKDFLNITENGKKVNKTFPGAAILYLPFFLIAHGLALLFGADADGYSILYQYLFDLGYWVYLLLGAIFFVKVFRVLKFKEAHIYITLFTLLVGTNMLFYSMVDQSVTHIFNFAMINGLIFQLLKFKESLNRKRLFYAMALLVLIGITRPTNVLVFLLVPIFIFEKQFYIDLFKRIFNIKNGLILLFIAAVIGSIPFILWQWQTENWVVYSYGDEGFDFSNPEISNFLFSYMKGWFTYTPIALIILLPGLYYLYCKSVYKTFLTVFFYGISIYIFSSWWCWYYGAGMGQRVMIDHYILLGFLMLLSLQYLPKLFQRVFVTLISLLVIVNVVQAAQIKKGIYKMGSPTKEMYWDNFLSLTLKAKVYEKANWQLMEEETISFNPKEGFITKGIPKKGDEAYLLQTNKLETYSPSFSVELDNPTQKIVIGFKALAQTLISDSRLVLTTPNENIGPSTIYLKEFMVLGTKTQMEYLLEFNEPINEFEAYFWNGNTEEIVDYSDFKVQSYQ